MSRLSTFPNLRAVVAVALVTFVVSSSVSFKSLAGSTEADGWENPAPPSLQECADIDRSLVFAIPTAHRPEAIGRLENAAVIELTAAEIHTFLDLPAETSASGVDWIKNEIGRLSERRRTALESHQSSWSIADQQRLDRLTTTISEPTTSSLRPFLVRAIAKWEGTGVFFGSICGENLVIIHGSLGHSTPPSIRVPVIVFLQKRPMAIYTGWTIAE